MNNSRVFSILSGLMAVIILSCNNKNDLQSNSIEALLKSNEIQREAHLTNNAILLVSQIADTMVDASNGKIQYISNQSIEERYKAYFSNVKYTSWDDVQPPVIYLSDDASQASMYVKKLIDIQYKGEDDKLGEHQYSLFSWNSDYKKINDEWKIIGITSTEKVLTKKEALKFTVQLSKK